MFTDVYDKQPKANTSVPAKLLQGLVVLMQRYLIIYKIMSILVVGFVPRNDMSSAPAFHPSFNIRCRTTFLESRQTSY
jgi:hypothetical protein